MIALEVQSFGGSSKRQKMKNSWTGSAVLGGSAWSLLGSLPWTPFRTIKEKVLKPIMVLSEIAVSLTDLQEKGA